MKDGYELSGTPRRNHYAEKIKKHGFSVSIHYDTPESVASDEAVGTIKGLLARPGLNSLHIYLNGAGAEQRG